MDTAKDMYLVYSKTATVDLIKNKFRKQYELAKLAGLNSYWARKEKARLEYLIKQIDAVIQSRVDQVKLFD